MARRRLSSERYTVAMLRTPTRAAATLALLLCAAARASAADWPPVFTTDVAPIIFTACTGCHRPGGDAPFSLTTYDEVRRRAGTHRDGYEEPLHAAMETRAGIR